MKVIDCCSYGPKSTIKAGEATSQGQYMFFTSSVDESKRYSEYIYDDEAIIMGTGGNATLLYYYVMGGAVNVIEAWMKDSFSAPLRRDVGTCAKSFPHTPFKRRIFFLVMM